MSDIRIICCDIDGTLVKNDKSLSETNRYWIHKAVEEKGIKFVLCSGRILKSLKYYYEILGISGLSSCLNGTFLVDEKGNVISNHTLPKEIGDKIVSIKEIHTAEMLCISGDKWYTESREGYLYSKKRPIYMQDSIIINPRDLLKQVKINKFLFMSMHRNELKQLEKDIMGVVDHPQDICFYPGQDFLEVMCGGINKGTAVDDLIAYYHLDRSQVMAIGDDINDIEMLQKAGLGIAMGNAYDSVKAVADDITDTNENDGVAKAIQKWVFSSLKLGS